MREEAYKNRSDEVQNLARWFDYKHLPLHLQSYSKEFSVTAERMIRSLPDSQQLVIGLQKLLEAKDCFVRAAVEFKDHTERRVRQ